MEDVYYLDTEVLSLSGQVALAWYQAVQEKRNHAPGDFDWQSLAQGAALRARLTEVDESLAWAELATATYHSLADTYPDKSFDHSEMYCRAAMIEKHGAQQNHALLDPDIIFQWFRHKLPTDYFGTVALIGRLAEELTEAFEVEVVKPLRAIKNRLTVIQALPDMIVIPDDLQQFMPLWGDLP